MNQEQQEIYCQSCGMPLTEEEHFGTNADGTKSEDYCSYCYQGGVFQQDVTMEEMIDLCLQMGEGEEFFKDPEAAKKFMTEWFPTLKRWKR